MNLFDHIEVLNSVVQFLGIYVVWSCFHDDFNAVTENGDSCAKNQDRKNVGADWIRDLPLGLKKNYDAGGNDADTLYHVT